MLVRVKARKLLKIARRAKMMVDILVRVLVECFGKVVVLLLDFDGLG